MDAQCYLNKAVIPPHKEHNQTVEISHIVVDSKDRNKTSYPNPGEYSIDLPDGVNDIIEARLVYADVKTDAHTVNPNFNTLLFDYGGTEYELTLDEGDYTAADLVTEVNDQIALVGGLAGLVATLDSLTNKVVFTGTSATTLVNIGVSNNASPLLGFYDDVDYVGTGGSFTITSPKKIDVDYGNYAALHIDNFNLLDGTNTSTNCAFAIAPYTSSTVLNSSQLFFISTNYTKYFTPRIRKLTKLNIQWRDRSGGIYQFNSDHRFEILFKRYKYQFDYKHMYAN